MARRKYTGYLIGGGVLLLVVIYLVTLNNSLVKKQEQVKLTWAEVQNTYQRRMDLVPSIVNVVKGVSGFEQETFTRIAEARSKTGFDEGDITAENYKEQRQVQDSLAAAVNRVILLLEKYPNLKATEAFSGLQTQLAGTERRIRVARQDFNEAIADYNNKVRSFPASLFASILGFKKREGFEAEAGSDKAVEIKF